jgi:outer membrane protein insertion porin family
LSTDALRVPVIALFCAAFTTVALHAQGAADSLRAQEVADSLEGPRAPDESDGPSLLLVDAETRIESVGFRFVSGTALNEQDLWLEVATRPLSPLTGIQEALDFIPGIRTPMRPIFSPLALQKDVARILRQYHGAGFVEAKVDYDVRLDTAANRVDIDFVVDQGRPLVFDSVSVRWTDRVPPPDEVVSVTVEPWPEDLQAAWEVQLGRTARIRGTRLSDAERTALEVRTAHWFLDRGFPWAVVRSEALDTTDYAVDVELVITPGPRARVDEIVLEGNRRLDEEVVRREIPIDRGDWYNENAVATGESELYELEIIRRALGGVQQGQDRDSTVTLRFQVEEARPRTIWGRAGWGSEGGVAGEGHWTHRNFLGGARTLTGSAAVETGWAALEAGGWTAGAAASVRQPYLGHSRISGTVGPFLRARDDIRDQSLVYGIEAAAIYKAAATEMVTLQVELSRVGVSNVLELLPVQALVAAGERNYSPSFVRSLARLTGTYGWLDDRTDPRYGYLIEPSLEATAPGWISDVQYFRMALETLGALPITRRVGLFARATAGRVFPYGSSDPAGPNVSRSLSVALRDAMFTTGGTTSVRGWGNGLLGPKIPDVRIDEEVGTPLAHRYVPVGGLARLTGSLELLLPFPFLSGRHRTFAFIDAGRVWTPGSALAPPDAELAVERWGFGTGGGVQIATPFGPVRLSLGYKLNPSIPDLVAPDDVMRALAAGGDLASLPREKLRRWHLHLAIGRSL